MVSGPELFFGLVAPIGVGGGTITAALEDALEDVEYGCEPIRMIDQLRNIRYLGRAENDPIKDLSSYKNEKERYEKFIETGDSFCRIMGSDALVATAIKRLLDYREGKNAGKTPGGSEKRFTPLKRHAYVFRSLKRPGEADRLRAIYENSFFLISAYAPHAVRAKRLANKLASSGLQFDPDQTLHEAERLMWIDQKEVGKKFGQNVKETFAKADYFIDATKSRSEITAQIGRFIKILFDHQFYTPTQDEQGMAIAHIASLRSAHLSRQVGAAIAAPDGSIIAIGCNEVPRAGGGLYWPSDQDDTRDFQLRKNISLKVRHEVLGDTIERLCELKWIKEEIREEFKQNPEKFLEKARGRTELENAKIMDAIEFDRSIHAEMAAITDAVRHGIKIKNCTLYTTTFPCHNCARHIAASGIRRVVYIHPYEKSLTNRLHGDAIGIDLAPQTGKSLIRFDPFLGISPNLYITFFTMGKRRGDDGRWGRIVKWNGKSAVPRIQIDYKTYVRAEEKAVEWLFETLDANELAFKE